MLELTLFKDSLHSVVMLWISIFNLRFFFHVFSSSLSAALSSQDLLDCPFILFLYLSRRFIFFSLRLLLSHISSSSWSKHHIHRLCHIAVTHSHWLEQEKTVWLSSLAWCNSWWSPIVNLSDVDCGISFLHFIQNALVRSEKRKGLKGLRRGERKE